MPRFAFGSKGPSDSPRSKSSSDSFLSDKKNQNHTGINSAAAAASDTVTLKHTRKTNQTPQPQANRMSESSRKSPRRSRRSNTSSSFSTTPSVPAAVRKLPSSSSSSSSKTKPSSKSTKSSIKKSRTSTKKKKSGPVPTPTSVVKTGRHGIEIRTKSRSAKVNGGGGGGGEKEDLNGNGNGNNHVDNGGFADDSVYWEAAKLAATQDTPDDKNNDGKGSNTHNSEDEEENQRRRLQQEKEDKKKQADLKKLERLAALKRAKKEQLKKQHDYSDLLKTPNYLKGTETTTGTSYEDDGHDSDTNNSTSGSFVKKALSRAARRREGSGSSFLSPSDISQASPIPMTPAMMNNTNGNGNSNGHSNGHAKSARSNSMSSVNTTNELLKSMSDENNNTTPISALKKIRIFGNEDDEQSLSQQGGSTASRDDDRKNDEMIQRAAHADIDIDHTLSGDMDDTDMSMNIGSYRDAHMNEINDSTTTRPLSPLVEEEFTALHSPLHEDAEIDGVGMDVDEDVDVGGIAKEDMRKAALEENIESVIGQSEGIQLDSEINTGTGSGKKDDDVDKNSDVELHVGRDGDLDGDKDANSSRLDNDKDDGNADMSGIDIQEGDQDELPKENIGEQEPQEEFDNGEGWDDDIGVGFELADDQDQQDEEPKLAREKDQTKEDLASSDDEQTESEVSMTKRRENSHRSRDRKDDEEQHQEDPQFEHNEEADHSDSVSSLAAEERTPKSSIKRTKRYSSDPETPAETPVEKVTKKKRSRKRVSISTPEARTYGGNSGVRMYQVSNREYETVPLESFEQNEDDEERNGVRRSKRRRFPPVEYWKNERIDYEANTFTGPLADVFGDMPMPTGVIKAKPTPYKKKVIRRRMDTDDEDDNDKPAEKKKKYSSKAKVTEEHEDEEVFDTSKLQKKYKCQDGDAASVWLESEGRAVTEKIVHFRERVKLHDLPRVKKRKKGESKVVAKASQTFNVGARGDMPGYINGCMELPPTSIKDDESVGPCIQLFVVVDCQPKSLELAMADPNINEGNWVSKSAQRFFLSKGDQFHIPSGNVYRLENHSKTKACSLTWTLVRPSTNNREE